MEKLRRALLKMPETGVLGFEGLVKRLLELILGEQFVLARAGDQPSGDAHNTRRTICVQAKRYNKASPQAKIIEGDFDQNLRAMPSTDIYVLAVTRETTQLDDTLDAMREKSAVDIVVWDFGADDAALPILCIEFWSHLQDFRQISAINNELAAWVSATQNAPSHKERLDKLRSGVRECLQTLGLVQQAARSYLMGRFQLQSANEPMALQPIRLAAAIDRSRYRAQAIEWWTANKAPILVIEAPEGYGKTWVAAQSAWEISARDDSIVLWLDSLQWRDCESVDAVLNEAVSRILDGDAKKTCRLVRKFRDRWSGRVLIVLDGVSERNALPSAQKILEDLALKHPGSCRVLFTTRPLVNAASFEPALWTPRSECKLEPFDDSELMSALAQAHILSDELPDRLRPTARIPRYFATCLKLRERLQQFENISVALVIWVDLLEKIGGFEPSVRQSLGLTNESDAIEVLIKLATSLPDAVAKGEALDLLNRCFGGRYEDVRNYLKELRIMERAGKFEATLSREHTVLGRALLLQQALQDLPNSCIRDTADRLLQRLEPFENEDGGSEALFVTLQLTAIKPDSRNNNLSEQRGALLLAWIVSHNSNASNDRLTFWCNFDTNAYAFFLEAFFEQDSSGWKQEFVVNPLARMWRSGNPTATLLESYIRRWLLFVWFEGCSGEFVDHKGYKLPIAKNDNQIRLGALAISLLSVRKENKFITDLALCLATEELTWREIRGHSLKHKFKSISDNAGILLRWHYTERILPEIERMALANSSDELLLSGLRWLAYELHTVEIPPVLQFPPSDSPRHYFGTPAIDLIRQGHRVFDCVRTELHPKELNFSHLAVRDDLPPLLTEDVELIQKTVKALSSKVGLHSHSEQREEDIDMHAVWPWMAKHHPMELAEISGELHIHALKRDNQKKIPPMFWFMRGVLPKLDSAKVTEWELLATNRVTGMKGLDGGVDEHLGLLITEAALLALPEESLHRWFLASACDESRRYSMWFSPITDLIPLCIPEATRLLAVKRCIELESDALGPIPGPPTEFGYWCYVASLVTKNDEKLYEWAKGQLLKRKGIRENDFSLIRLWLRAAPPGRLEADLRNPSFAALFGQRALRAWGINGELNLNLGLLAGTFDELMGSLPKGFVGGIFALTDRESDLSRWAKELFAVAFCRLGKPPFERRSKVETQIRLGPDRMIRGVGFESPPAESNAWSGVANFWGMDNGDLGKAFSKSSKRQQTLDTEFALWRSDQDQIKKWDDYDLHFFGAWPALDAWSRRNREEFLRLSTALLDVATLTPRHHWHIGGFLYALVCCMLPSSPKEAWHYLGALNEGSLRIDVRSDYDVPEFFVFLWDMTRCSLPEHDELRRDLFVACQNEFEVMVQCVAALGNNAEPNLIQIAGGFLQHETARDRALGVSIMAWVGTQEAVDRLNTVAQTDASQWVRWHACWAKEVSSQERSARSFFRKLLHESNPYLMSSGFQVLEPALTPVARLWGRRILKEEKEKGLLLDRKAEAVFESFWSNFESTHSNRVKIFGRELGEFCRGEKLDSLRTPKLAPWWKLR